MDPLTFYDRYIKVSNGYIRRGRVGDIAGIERIRWRYVEMLRLYNDRCMKPWWGELARVGTFYYHGDSGKIGRYVYSMEHGQGSFHTETVDGALPCERVLLAADGELPLMIGESWLTADAAVVLERRMKGEIGAPVWREDLHKRYERGNYRYIRLCRLKGLCTVVLDRYVYEHFIDVVSFCSEADLQFRINGRDYWYRLGGGKVDVIRRPEGSHIFHEFKEGALEECRRVMPS